MSYKDQKTFLTEKRNELRRRKEKLEIQQSKLGYNTPPEIINQIEDISNEINKINKDLESIQLDVDIERYGNKLLKSSTVRTISRRISRITNSISIWESHLICLKSEFPSIDQHIITSIHNHISFLKAREERLYEILDMSGDPEYLFSYSRDILFKYCDILKDIYILDTINRISEDEHRELLRDARYCLKIANENGLQKGNVYFYLAAISYELNDESPESIYESCIISINKNFNYPELSSILIHVCKVLSDYPNQYQDEAKQYLIQHDIQEVPMKRKRKNNKKVPNPAFCPNFYLKQHNVKRS